MSSRRRSTREGANGHVSQVEVRRDSSGDVIEQDEEEERDLDNDAVKDEEGGNNGGGGGGGGDESEGEEEEEEDDTPGEQPLNDDSIPVLRTQSHAYASSLANVDKARALVADVAVLSAEITQGVDERGKELDAAHREISDLYQASVQRRAIIEDLIQKIARGEEVLDVAAIYREAVDEQRDAYEAKTSRQKYATLTEYVTLKEQVWEAYNTTAMPPMVDQIPAEAGDAGGGGDGDSDDDFAVGGMLMDFKCPITMAVIDNPVTSKTCKHSYSKDAMDEYLAQNGRNRERAQCPKAGCDKVVGASVLFDDRALAKRIAGYKRRLEARNESRMTQTTLID